jgi:transposase
VAVAITRKMEAKELRRLARLEKSGRVAARMLAIANVLSGMSRRSSAELAGMDRQTLRDWVHRFNEEGVEGLRDRKRSGRPENLSEAERERFCNVLEAGPDPERDGLVRWRRIDLKAWLEKECGITYHERSVGKLLKRYGYSHLSVRPEHTEADPVLLEDFKKTLPQRSRKSSLNAPKVKRSNSGSRTRLGSARKAR